MNASLLKPAAYSMTTRVRALGHFVEQPEVIRRMIPWAWGVGAAGTAAIFARDVSKAQPGEERRKEAIRSALVLGATAAGTVWGAYKFKLLDFHSHGLAKTLLNEMGERYGQNVQKLLSLPEKTASEFRQIIHEMKETAQKGGEKALKQLADDMERALPIGDHHGPAEAITSLKGFLKHAWEESVEHMAPFMKTGLASVLSGFGGGMAANALNGEKVGRTSPMVKEGVFQYIANIALCAVGASAALTALAIPPVAQKLKSMGWTGKAIRTGTIGAGLSLGIVGGGAIANAIGTRWINPMIDKMAGRTVTRQEKRSIEFADAILHLDDVPTGLALAGVEILKPFIPLFFAFSGYRTGMGYRNDKSAAPESAHKARNPFQTAGQAHLQQPYKQVFQPFYLNNQQFR